MVMGKTVGFLDNVRIVTLEGNFVIKVKILFFFWKIVNKIEFENLN